MARSSRFRTAAQVFQAFPHLREQISLAPKEEPPADFVKALLGQKGSVDAILFCAFLLPRLEATWWACRCVRHLGPSRDAGAAKSIEAAERWVEDPLEPNRVAAMTVGMEGDRKLPETWLALAAGWSGGSLGQEGAPPVPPPPQLSGQVAAGAVILALAGLDSAVRQRQIESCAVAAVAYAEGEELQFAR